MAYSFSALDTYVRCPARYFFKYIQKETPLFTNDGFANLGKNIHSAIEHNDISYVMDSVEGIGMYRYAMSVCPRGARHEVKLAVNRDGQAVSFDAKDAFVYGIIDAIHDGCIYDWKSGYKEPSPRQLGVYHLLAEANEIPIYKLVFVMLRKQTITEVQADYELFEATKKWLQQTIDEIERCTDFYPKPSSTCLYCEYVKKCTEKHVIDTDTPEAILQAYIMASNAKQALSEQLKRYVIETGKNVTTGEFEFGVTRSEVLSVRNKKELIEVLRADGLLEQFSTIESKDYKKLLAEYPQYSNFFKTSFRNTVGLTGISIE